MAMFMRYEKRLLDRNDEVFAHTPETIGIGDAEGILPLGICVERVAIGGMGRHKASTLGVEFDNLIDANVNLRKIILIEITVAQHVATRKDVLFLQLALVPNT